MGIKKQQNWTRFKVDIDEDAFTLYPLDLVEYEKLNQDYQNNIDSEGVLLYEEK